MVFPNWKSQFWFLLLIHNLIYFLVRLLQHKNFCFCRTTENSIYSLRIMQALYYTGLSHSASENINNSWRAVTRKQKRSAWVKWFVWNHVRFANPFRTTELIETNFLTYLYMMIKSYSVINSYKAMSIQRLPFLGIQ